MKRIHQFYINGALLCSFFILSTTGFLRWMLKPWTASGIQETLMQAGCRYIGILHRWSALIFTALALYHIYCHWNWFIAEVKKHTAGSRDRSLS